MTQPIANPPIPRNDPDHIAHTQFCKHPTDLITAIPKTQTPPPRPATKTSYSQTHNRPFNPKTPLPSHRTQSVEHEPSRAHEEAPTSDTKGITQPYTNRNIKYYLPA
ncbi:hypothetical protein KC19_5G040500 [Ceratodon purpureus]|uniref:Uncharacterized protein n=1 Tax=Ceratodon purpureus TaxID=3225 RepID=A0A8T0HXU1_CERPU|nr:hypothetical protein KC19_5G040500 [Ceratodon purpureus]